MFSQIIEPDVSRVAARNSGPEANASPARTSLVASFLIILAFFSALLLASWPLLLSFDLWVMGDKSSFLNLDFLFAKHYLLGVEACYSYGLLPVFIQHLAFQIFGRGYKPVLGCTIIVMVLMALFWALLLQYLPRQRRWPGAIAALSPIILLVNPNLPYSLVILSMLFALWYVLERRLDIAMAVSAVGCFCVPSLPLALTGLLGAWIVAEWWLEQDRRLAVLARRLAPGVLVYAGLVTVLSLFFGYRAMLATALPTNGVRFYKMSGWYGFSRCLVFFHPPGYGLKYYLAYYAFSPVTWFTLSLAVLAIVCARDLFRLAPDGQLRYDRIAMLLCLISIVVFLFFAFGGRGQQEIYQPVLVVGALLAIASLPGRTGRVALLLFVVLGLVGEAGQAYKTVVAWRTTRPTPESYGLYVDPAFDAEFSRVVSTSQTHKLLLLSYATGEHFYYPTVKTPDVWFLQPGLMFASDRQRVLNQIDGAEIVVEDLTRFHFFQDYDPDVRPRLAAMCLVSSTNYFRIWRRPSTAPGPCQLGAVAAE